MLELIAKAQPHVELVAQALLALVVLATALSRALAKGAHADKVDSIAGKILMVIQYLPTLGLNPKTKSLEAQLESMKKAEAPAEPAE